MIEPNMFGKMLVNKAEKDSLELIESLSLLLAITQDVTNGKRTIENEVDITFKILKESVILRAHEILGRKNKLEKAIKESGVSIEELAEKVGFNSKGKTSEVTSGVPLTENVMDDILKDFKGNMN